MEKQMMCSSSTYHVCLQETSVVRLVAKLWTSFSMMKRLLKINFKITKGMPRHLHNAILLKIMDLNALSPESKKKIQVLAKPVGESIFTWLQGHEDFFDSLEEAISFCPNLRWCPDGTIDNRATAEIMLEMDELDYMKRFILACIYCFEQQIVVYWKELKLSGGEIDIDEDSAFKYPLAKYWLEFLRHKTAEQLDFVAEESSRTCSNRVEDPYSEGGGDDEGSYSENYADDDYYYYYCENEDEEQVEQRYIVETPRSHRKSSRSEVEYRHDGFIMCPTLLDKKSKAKLKTITKKSNLERQKYSEDDVINFLEYGFDMSEDVPSKTRTRKQLKEKEDDQFLSYINCCPTMNVHNY